MTNELNISRLDPTPLFCMTLNSLENSESDLIGKVVKQTYLMCLCDIDCDYPELSEEELESLCDSTTFEKEGGGRYTFSIYDDNFVVTLNAE